MHIITGATGHIGSAVVDHLLARGEAVLAITHDEKNTNTLKQKGAQVAVVDLHDVERLAETFSRGETLFLLNPPGDTSKDADRLERETISCLLQALARSSVQRVVAASTQCAQLGHGIGDLGTLFALEKGLRVSGRAVRIVRGGFYFTNFDPQLASTRASGEMQGPWPADFLMSMVSPFDVGLFDAELMLKRFDGFEIIEVTGPRDYTFADVAGEFARVSGRAVSVRSWPRAEWFSNYQKMGFSPASAESYAAMTEKIIAQECEPVGSPIRLKTTLRDYFEQRWGREFTRQL